MRKILFSLILLFILIIKSYSQAPEAFSFQAIARDSLNNLLINTKLLFRISIIYATADGKAEYIESFNAVTNQFGIANLKIGKGKILAGTFSTIKWNTGSYYLKIEISKDGKNFTIMGTTMLLSVPYALYSNVAGEIGSQGSENKIGVGNGPTGPSGPTGRTGPIGPTGATGVPGIKV